MVGGRRGDLGVGQPAVLLAFLLLILYGAPLFFPPAAVWPAPLADDAGLCERVFPGVPAWWVLGRLACLFVGAAILAFQAGSLPIRWLPSDAASAALPTPPRALVWIALALALLQTAAAFFLGGVSNDVQALYFVLLGLPAAVLALSELPRLSSDLLARARQWFPLAIMPMLWLTFVGAITWRSPRAASVVDGWTAIERMTDVAVGSNGVLTGSAIPGFTNAYMVLEGIPFLGPGKWPITFVGLQAAHLFWLALSGVAVGVIVWRMVGRNAAVVSQAAFLFSPFVLALPPSPLPTFIGPLSIAVMFLLLITVRERQSAAALVAFGAVAGFAGRVPQLTLLTLLLCVLLGLVVRRCPRIPRLALIVAALCFAAAVIPGFPDLRTIAAMREKFATGGGQLQWMVLILFGQWTPSGTLDALSSARGGTFDVPLGALLSPFATARAPMRLGGDALFDPITTALVAIAVVLCLSRIVHDRRAALPLAVVAAGMATAAASSGDAVSHTRIAGALVPIGILAGVGFEVLRTRFAGSRQPAAVAAAVSLSIAVAGAALFDRVNPRILPASSLEIGLEAVAENPTPLPTTFLEYETSRRVHWLFVDTIAALLPTPGYPASKVADLEKVGSEPGSELDRVYVWSPALETDEQVSDVVCRRWPSASLYVLLDRPGLFRALAAGPPGETWTPSLPRERWSTRTCDQLDQNPLVPPSAMPPLR